MKKLTCFLMLLPIFFPAAALQADEWEWDPASGYHREEWYDPTDWFDSDQGIDYERDYYGSYYDDDATYDVSDYDDYSTYDWYDSYDGDFDNYGYDYYTNDWYDDDADFDSWYDY